MTGGRHGRNKGSAPMKNFWNYEKKAYHVLTSVRLSFCLSAQNQWPLPRLHFDGCEINQLITNRFDETDVDTAQASQIRTEYPPVSIDSIDLRRLLPPRRRTGRIHMNMVDSLHKISSKSIISSALRRKPNQCSCSYALREGREETTRGSRAKIDQVRLRGQVRPRKACNNSEPFSCCKS